MELKEVKDSLRDFAENLDEYQNERWDGSKEKPIPSALILVKWAISDIERELAGLTDAPISSAP